MDTTAHPAGVDVASVERWFATEVPQAEPPFTYELIAGGHSNLTYRVTDATGARFVLRRPPLNSVLATAHDMGREWRAIHALQDTPVPVAPALGFCPDPEVTGAPFYVMGFVDGVVQHTIEQTLTLSPEQRRISGESLFDVLADLHAVDIDAVGLSEHGPRSGFIERTIRRWYKQYQASVTREVPDVDAAYEGLLARLPQETELTIAHGDYRLGNCITSFEGPIAAVLDWEISTLGDPLAELSYVCMLWRTPKDWGGLEGHDLASLGLPGEQEVIRYYCELAKRPLPEPKLWEFYMAYNLFRVSCIRQGVYARSLDGTASNVRAAESGKLVKPAADLAWTLVERMGAR